MDQWQTTNHMTIVQKRTMKQMNGENECGAGSIKNLCQFGFGEPRREDEVHCWKLPSSITTETTAEASVA